ncbi:hypothetical protein M441DRAFT_83436 [Trichoderma asperellum CBS 433.97]|uniref:Uncharacterized protein n=1 Tax=Trichoderma asperellum (strain ATCC 204424 / CBS 433.97 / NBRC 101777) TaxID=1042311 RepID=A0A2T3YW60_TRIA4|nr:hypothetical protein M441DRAFT_83436 [Trichoderma asperellum CBS 433.97]PTB36801.1 hypothetical protein M441DRAFT_83436 [Trichoderma asperellum CBS 433.97]
MATLQALYERAYRELLLRGRENQLRCGCGVFGLRLCVFFARLLQYRKLSFLLQCLISDISSLGTRFGTRSSMPCILLVTALPLLPCHETGKPAQALESSIKTKATMMTRDSHDRRKDASLPGADQASNLGI